VIEVEKKVLVWNRWAKNSRDHYKVKADMEIGRWQGSILLKRILGEWFGLRKK